MCGEKVQCQERKGICANNLSSIQITNLFLVCEARLAEPLVCIMAPSNLWPRLLPRSDLSSSSLSSPSVSSDIYFCRSQVNGVNIEGLRHSEVVALIRAGGEEVRLLVVDPETDELFLRLGLTPTTSHDKGKTTHTNKHTQL